MAREASVLLLSCHILHWSFANTPLNKCYIKAYSEFKTRAGSTNNRRALLTLWARLHICFSILFFISGFTRNYCLKNPWLECRIWEWKAQFTENLRTFELFEWLLQGGESISPLEHPAKINGSSYLQFMLCHDAETRNAYGHTTRWVSVFTIVVHYTFHCG